MAHDKKSGPLGAVYGASSTAEVAGHYDRWASTYDADMSTAGYRHPTIGLALLARHLPRGARPLLDAGVGTGLMGEWLQIAGYPEIEGLDISDGMLAVAARRGSYARLHKLALGAPLPFADGAFAGIVSVGVFTTGHVGAEGLDELVRICRPGGVIVLTVKTTLLAGPMETRLAAFTAAGRIARLAPTEPSGSMPGEAGTIPSCALVLKVTGPG